MVTSNTWAVLSSICRFRRHTQCTPKTCSPPSTTSFVVVILTTTFFPVILTTRWHWPPLQCHGGTVNTSVLYTKISRFSPPWYRRY